MQLHLHFLHFLQFCNFTRALAVVIAIAERQVLSPWGKVKVSIATGIYVRDPKYII